MKKLLSFMIAIVILGCVGKVCAIPGKRLIYGQVRTSTNTYIPIQVDAGGGLVNSTTTAGLVDVSSVISSSTTADVTIYHSGSLPSGTNNIGIVEDGRYSGYTSTGIAGRTSTTGDISNTPTIITNYSFYTQGGDAQVIFSGKSGILYVYEGIPIDTIVEIPLVSNTVTLNALTANATFNYEINGGN
jgi:hypothetical protein